MKSFVCIPFCFSILLYNGPKNPIYLNYVTCDKHGLQFPQVTSTVALSEQHPDFYTCSIVLYDGAKIFKLCKLWRQGKVSKFPKLLTTVTKYIKI